MALLVLVATLLAVPGSPIAAQARAEAVALPALSLELEKARAALDKHRDPIPAVHDGYLSTLGCIEWQLIGPTMDPAKPQVLIYEPDGRKLRLVAAEWFVPVEA